MSGFFRSDRAPLAPPIAATIYEGRVARTHKPGDALIYSTGPEHRDTEEVQRIVDQLPQLKVYLGHPEVFPASESGQKVVGYVESGRMDDDSAVARIVITDDETLKAIEAGTHELSLGYRATRDEARYQRGITLDHLAVVERARCGPVCALRVDEVEVEMLSPVSGQEYIMKLEITEEFTKALEAAVAAVKADALPCTCKNHAMPHNKEESMSDPAKTDDLAAEMAALKSKLDEANAALSKLEIEATNARKDAEVVSVKLTEAQAALEAARSSAAADVAKAKADAEEALATELATRVDARVGLLLEAGKVLKDTDLKAMSDRDIKCAVIKHVDGDEVPAEKSIDYVTGVYEGALKRAGGAAASREVARTTINDMRKDNAPLSGAGAERASKEKMTRDSAQAWTK